MTVEELIKVLKRYKGNLEVVSFTGTYFSSLRKEEGMYIERWEKHPKKVLCLYFTVEPDTLEAEDVYDPRFEDDHGD